MPLSSGALIAGRYKIVRLLGEGGFGAVYLAEDARLGRKTVAVKESFDSSREAQAQFQLEAQLLANLQHVGLPRVTDHFIEPDGRQYLVMDYVEGDDLDVRLLGAGRPLPVHDAVTIMIQICEAVDYLHSQRPQPIIHRDIKPPNIKLTRDGRAVLVDFGIAKIYHPSKSTVKVAKAVTPHFSSPEQYVGKTDARSDVYSLGATLYCLLCMDVPPDAMDRLTKGLPVPSPCRLNTGVSSALEQILFRSLDLTPANRFQNAGQLAAALRGVLAGGPGVPIQQRVICPWCGKSNRAGARFCAYDGKPLTGSPAPAGGAQQTAYQEVLETVAPEMLFEIANAYARNDAYSQAIPIYERCLQLGFHDQAVYHNLGLSYLLSDQLKQAAAVLEQGVSRYPQDSDMHYQLARAYSKLYLTDRAINAAERSCRLNPKDASKYWLFGLLLFDAERYHEAIAQFERCVALDPNDADSYFLLGRAYGETKKLSRAVDYLQQAQKKDPKDPEASFWIGVYYAREKKYSDAARAFEAVLRIKPDMETAHYLLGQVWLDLDKADRALPYFQKAVILSPRDADNHAKLALCYALTNNRTQAINEARHALSLEPDNVLASEIIRRL